MDARDFGEMREQRTLAELKADDLGYVRFVCARCPRTGKVALTKLRERFTPAVGLVNILNTLLPKDCPHAAPDPSGLRSCRFHYRDL